MPKPTDVGWHNTYSRLRSLNEVGLGKRITRAGLIMPANWRGMVNCQFVGNEPTRAA